ncbi:YunC family protein [Gorillibacterium sp. sgz500922]|uniref:YunC family protein n=1 Tax=Gorillibacterium sp. sgz500922 TaxID=3446694 RepID=UPI003F66BA47
MITMVPVPVGNRMALGIEVKLPKTTLIAVATDRGYIMCGALDVGLLNERLADRGILAGRAVGVRTLEELLAAPLESVTREAERQGIVPGMIGRDAVAKML